MGEEIQKDFLTEDPVSSDKPHPDPIDGSMLVPPEKDAIPGPTEEPMTEEEENQFMAEIHESGALVKFIRGKTDAIDSYYIPQIASLVRGSGKNKYFYNSNDPDFALEDRKRSIRARANNWEHEITKFDSKNKFDITIIGVPLGIQIKNKSKRTKIS